MINPPVFSNGQRIGLFGGSFNPPHAGHLAAALYALKKLELDQVWWVLTPQNPLKDSRETGGFAARLALTEDLASHPHFRVTDIEAQARTRTTADFLRVLAPILRRGRFVWIMGADSFANLHHWHDWTRIMTTLPVALVARPGYSLAALNGMAATRYRKDQIPANQCARLADAHAPAWVFLPMPLRAESSTLIRKGYV